MSKFMQDILMLLGRILFSFIFLMASYDKIMHFSETSALMASKGIFMSDVMLVLAIIAELGGALMVLLGLWTRLGATLLLLFIIPVTFVFHTFWNVEPSETINQMHHFLKNFAMLGGCLYIIANGSGRICLDKVFKE